MIVVIARWIKTMKYVISLLVALIILGFSIVNSEMPELVKNFAIQLIATFIGAGLAIPTGLYINRQWAEYRSEQERIENENRLSELRTLVKTSLTINQATVSGISVLIQSGRTLLSDTLDIATWKALESEYLSLETDASLKVSLAKVFSDLEDLNNRIALHRDYSVGVNAALGNSSDVKQQLESSIIKRCDHLKGRLDSLGDEL